MGKVEWRGQSETLHLIPISNLVFSIRSQGRKSRYSRNISNIYRHTVDPLGSW